MTPFSILVTDTFRPVYLYLDIMTSYTLSPFLLTRVQTAGAVIDFYIHVLLHAAYFWFFLILFLSFPETNLGKGREGSVKDEGRLLTDSAYEALTLWVCMFLKFHNAPIPWRLIAK